MIFIQHRQQLQYNTTTATASFTKNYKNNTDNYYYNYPYNKNNCYYYNYYQNNASDCRELCQPKFICCWYGIFTSVCKLHIHSVITLIYLRIYCACKREIILFGRPFIMDGAFNHKSMKKHQLL